MLTLIQILPFVTPLAHAQPNQAIYWASYPFPSVYIDSGEQQGQGIAGQMLKVLQRELPAFKHHNYSSSFTRIMRILMKSALFVPQ